MLQITKYAATHSAAGKFALNGKFSERGRLDLPPSEGKN